MPDEAIQQRPKGADAAGEESCHTHEALELSPRGATRTQELRGDVLHVVNFVRVDVQVQVMRAALPADPLLARG